jgi:hypothetical protein
MGISSLHAHRNALYAAPTMVAGILWGSLMLYFLIYYETLPRDHDGTSPELVTLTPPFLLHLLYPRNPTALLPRLCNCGS